METMSALLSASPGQCVTPKSETGLGENPDFVLESLEKS